MNGRPKISVAFIVVLLTLATFGVLSFWLLHHVIGGFYNSNAMEGNYGSKYLWVFALAVFLNWLYALCVAIGGAAESKLKKVGLSAVILLLLLGANYGATFVPTNYHVEYYLGQEKYSIPWQYNPINGSSGPGGTYFVIHVSYPNLIGQYSDDDYYDHRLVLSKYIFDEKKKIGASLDDIRYVRDLPTSNMYFVDSGFLYLIRYEGDPIIFRDSDELNAFKESIVDLFDSFRQ